MEEIQMQNTELRRLVYKSIRNKDNVTMEGNKKFLKILTHGDSDTFSIKVLIKNSTMSVFTGIFVYESGNLIEVKNTKFFGDKSDLLIKENGASLSILPVSELSIETNSSVYDITEDTKGFLTGEIIVETEATIEYTPGLVLNIAVEADETDIAGDSITVLDFPEVGKYYTFNIDKVVQSGRNLSGTPKIVRYEHISANEQNPDVLKTPAAYIRGNNQGGGAGDSYEIQLKSNGTITDPKTNETIKTDTPFAILKKDGNDWKKEVEYNSTDKEFKIDGEDSYVATRPGNIDLATVSDQESTVSSYNFLSIHGTATRDVVTKIKKINNWNTKIDSSGKLIFSNEILQRVESIKSAGVGFSVSLETGEVITVSDLSFFGEDNSYNGEWRNTNLFDMISIDEIKNLVIDGSLHGIQFIGKRENTNSSIRGLISILCDKIVFSFYENNVEVDRKITEITPFLIFPFKEDLKEIIETNQINSTNLNNFKLVSGDLEFDLNGSFGGSNNTSIQIILNTLKVDNSNIFSSEGFSDDIKKDFSVKLLESFMGNQTFIDLVRKEQ